MGIIGGIGVPELVIILAVVLLIFGPKNLPKLGASLGKTVKNIRRGLSDDDKKLDEVEVVAEGEDADVEAEPAKEEAAPAQEETEAEAKPKAAPAKKRTTTVKKAPAKEETEESAE